MTSATLWPSKTFFNHGDEFFTVHTGHFFDHGFDNWKIWFHHLEFIFHHFHDFTLDHFHHFLFHHFHIEVIFTVSFIKFFFPVFHFFAVFTVFLATSVNIDIGFNFSVDINPVLLIGVDWSEINIHNVIISFSMSHEILEFFPFFFHIVFHVMTILMTSHWAHVWLARHWLTRLTDRRVLVMSDWRSRDGGDEDC